MKDLDFDELDRAVNSLMTNVPKTSTQSPEPQEKTLNITSTLDSNATPSFDAIEKTAQQAVATPAPVTPKSSSLPTPTRPTVLRDVTPAHLVPPAPAPSRPQLSVTPATRRSGKFMDVVRPSSSKQDDERPISRQGLTIQPSGNPVVQDPVPQPEAPIDETQTQTEPNKEVVPVVTQPPTVEAPASDWPDPLDMQPATAVSTSTSTPPEPSDEEKETPVEQPLSASDQEPKNTDSIQEPLSSPFLPDAKVEKRPLGGLAPLALPSDTTEEPEAESMPSPSLEEEKPAEATSPSEASLAPSSSIDAAVKTEPDTVAKTPNDESVGAPLPEELSNDLMAVEADTTHDELKKEHENTAEQDVAANKEEVKEQTPIAAPTVHHDEKSSAGVSTSIPQQYHEVPSTGDKDSGSIYDTSTYHQPLAHPKKKNTGRTVLLWAVVVLLLGIAAGAALYFSGII